MSAVGVLLLGFFSSSFAFRSTNSFFINGKKYDEIVDQPWFRVHHSPHTKIAIEEAADSTFGQHNIPRNDVFIAPFWTDREKAVMHCLSLRCVCQFFGGEDLSEFAVNSTSIPCLLPSGKSLGRALRKEIRMLPDKDRIAFEDALNKMKKDRTYNRLSRIHKYSGVHSGPAFTVWHRELLKRFELVIRSYMPPPHSIGIPYWDTSLDALLPEPKDSIMFSPIFLGEVDEEGHVVTGPYANWTTMEGLPHITRRFGADPEGELLSPARIDWIAAQTDVNMVLAATEPLSTCTEHEIDERFLEYSHNYVHFFISGDMGKSWSSSNDVIFILHHSMIDFMFEMFRTNGQNRTARENEYPRSNGACFPPWHNSDAVMPMLDPLTNRDALSNGYTDEMYEFASRPECDAIKRDCGSKYLFCDTSSRHGSPRCISRVRPQGICTGYEGTDICYEGECVRGECQRGKKEEKGKKEKENNVSKKKSEHEHLLTSLLDFNTLNM